MQIPRIDIGTAVNAVELDPNIVALYGEGIGDDSGTEEGNDDSDSNGFCSDESGVEDDDDDDKRSSSSAAVGVVHADVHVTTYGEEKHGEENGAGGGVTTKVLYYNSVQHSYIHTFIHSYTHTLIHSYTHNPFLYLYTPRSR